VLSNSIDVRVRRSSWNDGDWSFKLKPFHPKWLHISGLDAPVMQEVVDYLLERDYTVYDRTKHACLLHAGRHHVCNDQLGWFVNKILKGTGDVFIL
jgi:hypothetical protein